MTSNDHRLVLTVAAMLAGHEISEKELADAMAYLVPDKTERKRRALQAHAEKLAANVEAGKQFWAAKRREAAALEGESP